eukprot:scaffold12212_cov122-Isochrysis_galbana.AAC.3
MRVTQTQGVRRRGRGGAGVVVAEACATGWCSEAGECDTEAYRRKRHTARCHRRGRQSTDPG